MLYREVDGGVEAFDVQDMIDGKVADPFKTDRRVKVTEMMIRTKWWNPWFRVLVKVSTVFLAVDHNFGDGPPVLYETMLFTDHEPLAQQAWRYTTRRRAEAAHNAIVDLLGRGPLRCLDNLEFLDPITVV